MVIINQGNYCMTSLAKHQPYNNIILTGACVFYLKVSVISRTIIYITTISNGCKYQCQLSLVDESIMIMCTSKVFQNWSASCGVMNVQAMVYHISPKLSMNNVFCAYHSSNKYVIILHVNVFRLTSKSLESCQSTVATRDSFKHQTIHIITKHIHTLASFRLWAIQTGKFSQPHTF